MRDLLTVTLTCAPGTATLERAVEFAQTVRAFVQAIADDIVPGSGASIAITRMQWVGDSIDEIVVTVTMPEEVPGD